MKFRHIKCPLPILLIFVAIHLTSTPSTFGEEWNKWIPSHVEHRTHQGRSILWLSERLVSQAEGDESVKQPINATPTDILVENSAKVVAKNLSRVRRPTTHAPTSASSEQYSDCVVGSAASSLETLLLAAQDNPDWRILHGRIMAEEDGFTPSIGALSESQLVALDTNEGWIAPILPSEGPILAQWTHRVDSNDPAREIRTSKLKKDEIYFLVARGQPNSSPAVYEITAIALNDGARYIFSFRNGTHCQITSSDLENIVKR